MQPAVPPVRLETSNERRLRKLRWLCERFGREKVAERAGRSDAYLRQILNANPLPSKRKEGGPRIAQVGDDLARDIEAAFQDQGIPHGWFDNDLPSEIGGMSWQLTVPMVLAIVEQLAQRMDSAPNTPPDFAAFNKLVHSTVQYMQEKAQTEGAVAAKAVYDAFMHDFLADVRGATASEDKRVPATRAKRG